ncbi:ZNF7 protein, partial [Erpornis zantholeuca]|nr:ZNF7 protein [Erpornis zantholeuca]
SSKKFRCHDCGKALEFPKKPPQKATERAHKCSECGKSFRLSSGLVAQRRRNSEGNPRRCPNCGKSFGAGSALVQHQRIHGSGICGKSFPGSSGL